MTRRASPVAGRSFPWEGMDEDRRNAVLLYALIGAVVLFAIGLIAWGYYSDRIAPKHETVLTVGNRKFDMAFLERRVLADLNNGNISPQSTLQDVVVTSLQSIELEELARVAGKAQGVTATDADIDADIRNRLGLQSDADRNTFAALYRQQVLKSGLPVKEYREIIAAQLIQRKFQDQFQQAVPNEGEQVDAQIIRTSAETTANTAKARIDAGEKFNLVALDASIDETKQSGGEIGWVTKGELTSKVAEALFSQPVGEVSKPVQDRNGWYILLARGRESRPIDTAQKSRIAARSYDNLIGDTREKSASTSRLSEDQIARIGRNLVGS